ncbi:hypothetical protein ASF28_11395 [Methylobacterium sp. Leaf99]|nr:hypothetical protein ASF28_11395 [Methylobacterium sp. Leaf99]
MARQVPRRPAEMLPGSRDGTDDRSHQPRSGPQGFRTVGSFEKTTAQEAVEADHQQDGHEVDQQIRRGGIVGMERHTSSAPAAAAAASPPRAAVRLGRSGQARRSISTSRTESGSDTLMRKTKQPRISSGAARLDPGAIHPRRQPRPPTPSQRTRGGSGRRAQAGLRPGTLLWKAANAAATAVRTAPRAA